MPTMSSRLLDCSLHGRMMQNGVIMVKDRIYQYRLEKAILLEVDYRDLWCAVSQWFSAGEIIEFLEDFAEDWQIDVEV